MQTVNLDGETNLKLRSAVDATRSLESADISVLRGSCQHEAPNRNLYKFEGLLSLSSGVSAALDNDNILLRGSQLRNTKHAYGLVVVLDGCNGGGEGGGVGCGDWGSACGGEGGGGVVVGEAVHLATLVRALSKHCVMQC